MRNILCLLVSVLLISGCATLSATEKRIRGPVETEIISNPPGAKIEVDNQYIGETPLKTTLERRYSSFMETADRIIIIKANPTMPGQYVQIKFIGLNDPLPTKVYFDMNLQPVPQQQQINVDVNK